MNTRTNRFNRSGRSTALALALLGATLSLAPAGSALGAPKAGIPNPADQEIKNVVPASTVSTNPISADYNGSGSVTPDDLFQYLAAWFAHDARADMNLDGAITVWDLMAYLQLWFANK